MARPALAATRAIEVLDLMAAHPTEVFTLSELAARLEINGASVHAVMAVLEAAGYASRHERHRTYGLGPAALALGHAALERHPRIDAARDEMRQLAKDLDLELLLIARVFDEMIAVARNGPQRGGIANLRVGQRVGLRPPLGSAFLAWDDAHEVDAWLARTATDLGASDSYRALLKGVRERGYSVGLEVKARERGRELTSEIAAKPRATHLRSELQSVLEEHAHGDSQLDSIEPGQSYSVAMIMAPIFDANGRAALALSMSGFRRNLAAEDLKHLGEQLRDVGLQTTRATAGLP